MIRLLVLVEGQSEEAFIKSVLAPHLEPLAIWAKPTIVGTPKCRGSAPLNKGGGTWRRWERDLRAIQSDRSPEARFTTMIDLYELPTGFPGRAEHWGVASTEHRCELIESALAEWFGDSRLIPYVQRHEFESLVLAALPFLREVLDSKKDRSGLDELCKALAGASPEDVNDGKSTSPSHRLKAAIPGYSKPQHGPYVLQRLGLAALRNACPRFDAWVRRLEQLTEVGLA